MHVYDSPCVYANCECNIKGSLNAFCGHKKNVCVCTWVMDTCLYRYKQNQRCAFKKNNKKKEKKLYKYV